MATVTGITAARAQEIADASVVSGAIDGNGHLILTTAGGTTIDAGLVIDNAGVVAHGLDTSTHGVGQVAGVTEAQSLSNKTLVSPIISNFTNATHDHSDVSEGGSIAVYSGVKALRTATQGVADSNSELLAFSATVAYDTDGYKTSNTVFTIPENGKYDLVALVPWASNPNGRRTVDIRLNDSSDNGSAGTSLAKSVLSPGHNADFFNSPVALGEQLNAGDYLKVLVYQNSGGPLDILGNTGVGRTHFTIKRVF